MHSRLLLLLLLGVVSTAAADDFSDFRRPTQSGTRLFFLTNSEANWQYYGDKHGSDKSDLVNSNLSITLNKFRESDCSRWETNVSTSLHLRRERQKDYYNGYYYLSDQNTRLSRNREVGEQIELDLTGDYYPFQSDIGGVLNLASSIDLGQRWNDTYQKRMELVWYHVIEESSDAEISEYRYEICGDAAIGFGKVRLASSVYSLHVLEERLMQLGIIGLPLQTETRHKLIDLFSRYKEYSYRNELQEKYFWNDLESILLSDPAFRDCSLGAYEWFRLNENIKPGILDRRTGFFGGPIVSCSYLYGKSRTSRNSSYLAYRNDSLIYARWEGNESSSYEIAPDIANVFLGLGGSYHRPLGIRAQLDAAVRFQLLVNPIGHGYLSQSDYSLGYVLTDKLCLVNSLQYYRLIEAPNSQESIRTDEWTVDSSIELQYWVEDQISLDLSLSHYQGRRHLAFPLSTWSNDTNYYRDTVTGIGLAYSFFGAGSSTVPPVSSYRKFVRRYSNFNPLP
jgi:hypothetical protein